MNAQAIEKRRLIKKHARRLLYAAASAVGAPLFLGAVAKAQLPTPDITVCTVYGSQHDYMETHYSDYDLKPQFYVQWDTDYGGNNFGSVWLLFYQGLNSTSIGTDCWQVYNDPDTGFTTPLSVAPDETSVYFFPWQQPYLVDDEPVWYPLGDFDEDETYEIGVQAHNDGSETDIVWHSATFNS